MIKIVLDTNIIISAFGWRGNEYIILQKIMNKEILLILSPEILDEYKRVLLLPRLGFQEDEIEDFIHSLLEVAELVYPTNNKQISIIIRDKDDLKFIICAIEAKADYIVSDDSDLLKEYNNIKIITTKKALLLFE